MKSTEEFSTTFDVLWNNISSNKGPGLNEYEKSIFFTKAQNEIIKNIFDPSSKGNSLGRGFDENAIRQIDFSNIVSSKQIAKSNDLPIMNPNALVYELPKNVYIIVNEEMLLGNATTSTSNYTYIWNGNSWEIYTGAISTQKVISITGTKDDLPVLGVEEGTLYNVTTANREFINAETRQIIPLSYFEYMRLMSKPFKQPFKRQAWRLMTKGNGNKVEIILTSADLKKYNDKDYIIRYVRKPKPIILDDLSNYGDNLSIDGVTEKSMCELNEALHDAIVQRAVELAKIAWNGDANETQLQITSGQRSE